MKAREQKFLIAAVTFLGGFYFFLEFLLPEKLLPQQVFGMPFSDFHENLTQSLVLIGAMAIGLGVINIVRVHGSKVLKGRDGAWNSLALLAGLCIVFSIEVFDFLNAEAREREVSELKALKIYSEKAVTENVPEKLDLVHAQLHEILKKTESDKSYFYVESAGPDRAKIQAEIAATASLAKELKEKSEEERARLLTALQGSFGSLEVLARDIALQNYNKKETKKASTFVFEAFFVPLGSAMFSLLAFYVATAAFRTFKVRSVEAAVMMSTALIVMLGQIPHGPIYISESLPDIRNWLLQNVSTPAFRAIAFGSSVAGLAMAIRVWFSLEKSPLSSDSEQ